MCSTSAIGSLMGVVSASLASAVAADPPIGGDGGSPGCKGGGGSLIGGSPRDGGSLTGGLRRRGGQNSREERVQCSRGYRP